MVTSRAPGRIPAVHGCVAKSDFLTGGRSWRFAGKANLHIVPEMKP